ncbi:hypothetical protein DRQ26_03530 [bacterium]|nr:MAG: hypothetical protein DRQ26_03530 [bacterium]
MNEVILIDGVKYVRYVPENEAELERAVVEHSDIIFGEDLIYLDIKKRLKSEIGRGTIPDGYLLDITNKKLWLIEVELSTHQGYDHIAKQIMTFNSALSNHRTRQKLASIIREFIENDPVLYHKAQKLGLDKNHPYEFLLNEIIEPSYQQRDTQVFVIVDMKTDKITAALDVVNPRPIVLQFQTFVRENVGNLAAHLHIIETMGNKSTLSASRSVNIAKDEKVRSKKSRARTNALKQREYHIPILESLVELGGSAKKEYIFERVYEKMKSRFSADDYLKLKNGAIRWKHICGIARMILRQKGFIATPQNGIWQITDSGIEFLKNNKR